MARLFHLPVICLSVAACARGLAPGEADFARVLFGDSLDQGRVVIQAGLGLTPPPGDPEPEASGEDPAPPPNRPPEGICTREPSPREGLQWPAGMVLWNQIFLKRDVYRSDMMAGWPRVVPLPQALLMAHELVHVWQWQNRARTDYDPATSGAETVRSRDPYWYAPEADRAFLTYGFEQQAAMIEDYVCYTMFDPRAPRRAALRTLIDPVLPLDGFDARLGR
ncbi:hypothetical protein [Aliiroseovarius sp.]|uniref:hypothetical protein n=1 Tax=Aliiroseovarius sp. TaxID=1872442 RepID=UPI0026046D6C|nr:hypothetical protein [Aliiroseovarius sp.]